MKKILSLLMALTILLACFGMSAEVPVVTVNSWSWVDSGWADCLNAVFGNFAETHQDVVIDLDTYSCAYADVMNNLLVQAPTQTTPDIAMVKAAWVPQLLDLGVLADISTAMPAEALADYTEAALGAYRVDGKIVAVPYFGQGYAMFYNKDLFEEAGITELPKTFDEVLECARKISALGQDDKGNTIYGLGLVNSETELAEGYNVFPWLWARGGDFEKDGSIVLDSEANLQAYTEIAALYADGTSPKGLSFKEMRNLFATGCLGMFWDLQSQTASFKAGSELGDAFIEHIGAFPIPGATKGTGVGYNDDVVLVMFNTCKNLEAAGVVLDYMTGATTIGYMKEYGKGKMSSRMSVMAQVYSDVSDPIAAAFVDANSTNHALPCMNLHFSEADEAITRSVTRLAQGEDPATVLKDVSEEITELYAE